LYLSLIYLTLTQLSIKNIQKMTKMTKMTKKHQYRTEQWIVRARRAGLTNKELAKLADISEAQFSKIIRGHVKDPKMSTIDRIEGVLESKGV